jgi:predicted MPP superfamily phosphohydrolase
MILWILGILFLIGMGLAGFSYRETGRVRHHRTDLFFEDLPAAFDGYTVLHLSDLHFLARDRKKKKRLAILNAEPVDLCVLTGDLIETDASITACVDALGRLRTADGTFCVLGNHDYFRYSFWDTLQKKDITDKPNRVEVLVRALQRNGAQTLRNESVEIRRNGGSIWLAGVDDPVTLHDDLSRTFDRIPADAFRIVLSHTPDLLKKLSLSNEGLVLAGHTHGGQIRIPFWGPLLNHSTLEPGFVSGKMKHGKALLLVTNGIGVNRMLPFRFLCRPQAHTIRLRKKGAAGPPAAPQT